jgi:hypothetical protein
VSSAALQSGKTLLVFSESVPSAGSQTRVFTLDSDTFQTSLFVSSISGSLTIKVYTLTQEGREKEVITYSNITAPSTELSLKKAATAMGVVKVVAVYTGACNFELRAKGLSSGETSAKIQSANTARATKVIIPTPGKILLPAALSDRKGIIIRNWSTTVTVYLGFSISEANFANGYPLKPQEALSIDLGAGAALYGDIQSAGTADVRIIEAGG